MRATVWVAASLIMSAAPSLSIHVELKTTSVRSRSRILKTCSRVGRGVARDLLARERRPRRVLAGRVADHPGEVADQKQDVMAELLELAQLVQEHGVAEVQVGRGRVEARLDAQRRAVRSRSTSSASTRSSSAPRFTISSASSTEFA